MRHSLNKLGTYRQHCLFVLVFFVMTGPVFANNINGFLEWNYSLLDTTSKSAAGDISTIKTTGFNQRYNLSLDVNLYPNLRLMSGGIFEDQTNTIKTNGSSRDSSTKVLRPFLE